MAQSNTEYQPDPVTMVAYHRALAEHADSLKSYASRLLSDPVAAEDVAQDAFLTAYQKAWSFRGEGSVRSWLMSIGVRKALDELRRRGRTSETALEEAGEPAIRATDGVDTALELEQALDKLGPEARTALMLKEVEGMSYREIADAMEWPIGTVATKLHRARLSLRELLSEVGYGVP